jgi:hypothetical protein
MPEKIALSVLLGMGLAATACGIAKVVLIGPAQDSKDPTYDGAALAIWSYAEEYIGILAACIPCLRSLFERSIRVFGGRVTRAVTRTNGRYYGDQSIKEVYSSPNRSKVSSSSRKNTAHDETYGSRGGYESRSGTIVFGGGDVYDRYGMPMGDLEKNVVTTVTSNSSPRDRSYGFPSPKQSDEWREPKTKPEKLRKRPSADIGRPFEMDPGLIMKEVEVKWTDNRGGMGKT